MPKDLFSNRAQMRERIAQLAARMIAEDGVGDFALAKRKAARQLGAPDSQSVPNNREIEQALKTYQSLFDAKEHAPRLRQMRQEALRIMDVFAEFEPRLTGGVLNGTAGRHASIELLLFTDAAKDLELFLINHGIPYEPVERRVTRGAETRVLPSYRLLSAHPVTVTVRDRAAQRNARADAEMADAAELRALLEATES